MFPLLRDNNKFIVFTKYISERKDVYYMDETQIHKSITPPEILENSFWKSTFQIHKDKKENEISVIIPYSEEGGHYHYLTKIN